MANNPIIMLSVDDGREVYINRRAIAYFERKGDDIAIVMVTGERFVHKSVRDFRAFWRDFDEPMAT